MVQIKICGLTQKDSLEATLESKADYIGLVFFPKSPRNIDLTQAGQLAEIARGRTKIVALIVDAYDDEIRQINRVVKPDFFQLHGSETADRLNDIKSNTNASIIKAFKIRSKQDVEDALSYSRLDFIPLFDAKPPEGSLLPGGNGEKFDWSLLNEWPKSKPFMLSGGLNTTNIQQAITQVNPSMVDVSSGVEDTAGIKSIEKIKSFIKLAKNHS